MYRGSRSSSFGASPSGGSNPVLSRLTTPSFSSITMLNKGNSRSSGGGGTSGWDTQGSGYGGGSNMGQSWNQGGNQNMGARQMEPYNTAVYLNMENAPPEFDAVTRVIGENGENLDYIRKTTGGQIQLQGRGTGIVNNKGLHIYIEHNQMPGLERAEKLAGDLVKVVQEEFMQWQEEAKSSRMAGGSSGYQGNQRNQGSRNMYNEGGRSDFGNQGYQDRQQDMGYNDGSRGGNYQDNQPNRDSDGVINQAKEAKPGMGGGYGSNQGGDNYSGGRFNEGMRDSDRGGRGQSFNQGSNWRGSEQQERRGQDWNEGQQGRRDGNFGRGSGQSDFRDNNQGNRDFQGQNRMETSGNWARQDNFNRDQGNRDNVAMNTGNQSRFNEPDNRGMDRGMDRNVDRGMDRNIDRGIDRSMDNRGMGRNMDRGMDNRGMDRDMERGVDNRGMDRNMERGIDNRGMDRNVDRGVDRGMNNRGMDRGRGMDHNMDRNGDTRGMDRNMDNRGMDRGMDNRGMGRNMENRGMDRGMDNRGVSRNMDNRGDIDHGMDSRGMGRNMDNRGMDHNVDNRGMDRNMENRGGMDRRREPAARQNQAKYCDICDAKFPNDEEYQVHCNGVFHAQKVLEMKNRNQGQRGANLSGGMGGSERSNVQRGDNQASRGQPQPIPDVWYPNRDGPFEQRWVFNQVEPMFERQLEADVLKKLQEHCRNTSEDLLPDRSQQHVPNYCKLCKSTYDVLEAHIHGHFHITQYVLRQLQMGVNDFVTYYGDIPIADVNTNGGRILALEALAWGPCIPQANKPQQRERFKKLVVLSGPFLGFKCQLCKARCRNMTFWVDHLTSQKHVKRIVRAVCALRRDGFSREFPDIPVCPPYFAAGCVLKLQGLRWHTEIQVPGNVLRAEPKNFLNERAWSDAGPPGMAEMGNNRGPTGPVNDMGWQGGPGPRQSRDGQRGGPRDGPGGPRGGGTAPRRQDGPRDGPGGLGSRGGPNGPRSGPRPLMDEPMSRDPGRRGSEQQGPIGQRPGPERQLGPKPLMGMDSATSPDNLSPADQELVMQVAQITGISDATLVVSALEALRALDPNMLQTLGALNTEAMPDLDPAMIQTLLDAIGGGQEGSSTGPRGPMGPGPRPGPYDKRRVPMGRSGGPPKKMRF